MTGALFDVPIDPPELVHLIKYIPNGPAVQPNCPTPAQTEPLCPAFFRHLALRRPALPAAEARGGEPQEPDRGEVGGRGRYYQPPVFNVPVALSIMVFFSGSPGFRRWEAWDR